MVTEEPDPPRRCGVLWPVISGLLARDPARRIGPAEAGEMLRQVAGSGPGPRSSEPGHGPATAPMPGVPGDPAGTSAMSGAFGMPGAAGTAEPAGTAAPEAADRSAAGSASTLQNAERTLAFHPQAPLLSPPDGDGGQSPPDEPERPRARAEEPAPEQSEPVEPELAQPEPELAEDPDVGAVSGAAPIALRPERRRRRRAGLLGGLLAAAAAVGIFTALDTLGHHQPQALAPSGTHHSSAAASQPARGSSATASTSTHAVTPTAGSGGTGSGPAPGAGAGVGSSAPVPAG
ncbi:MAG: hypothetical protein ACHP9Z_21950 [Streptosporangiales bacterium]